VHHVRRGAAPDHRTVPRRGNSSGVLARPDDLTRTEFRPLTQSELASEFEIDNASVSRATKDLLNRGIVERTGKGPVMKWRLSLKWGWRGNAAAFHAAVREVEAHRTGLAGRKSPLCAP
jgi:hypothetical protein